ncbi:hypothetical protein CHUAL_005768 [Chamberlinius hualienensis]
MKLILAAVLVIGLTCCVLDIESLSVAKRAFPAENKQCPSNFDTIPGFDVFNATNCQAEQVHTKCDDTRICCPYMGSINFFAPVYVCH